MFLSTIVPFLELFLSMPLSVTLTIFQGYSNVRQFQVKIVRSCPTKFKLCSVVKFVVYIMNVPLYSLSHLVTHKLVTHVESHASAVSLLESGE